MYNRNKKCGSYKKQGAVQESFAAVAESADAHADAIRDTVNLYMQDDLQLALHGEAKLTKLTCESVITAKRGPCASSGSLKGLGQLVQELA